MKDSLMNLADAMETYGKWSRIHTIWNEKYPALGTSKAALRSEYNRIKRLRSGSPYTPGASHAEHSSGESDSESDEESDGEGENVDVDPRSETCTPVAKRMTPAKFDEQVIRDGFREELEEMTGRPEGCFEGRVCLCARNVHINPDLITLVDRMIYAEFSLTRGSMWSLNCLVYAGAKVLMNAVQKARRQLSAKSTPRVPVIERCLKYIKECRSTAHRLTTELERRNRTKPMSKREKKRGGSQWVQRKFGKISTNKLREMINRNHDVICIKTRQMRDAKLQENSKQQADKLRTRGVQAFVRPVHTSIKGPSLEEVRTYWDGILGKKTSYNKNSFAVKGWSESIEPVDDPTDYEEPPPFELFRMLIRKTPCWKAAGRDKLKAFWWKKFPESLGLLYTLMEPILRGEVTPPQWLVTGRTELIPKPGFGGRADQMRPITCLNTCYKFLTKVLTHMITGLTNESGAMPLTQKALRKGRRGCVDALWIDQTLTSEAIRESKSLSVAWIDYSKAFDRVPHRWVHRMLRVVQAPKPVRKCIRNIMRLWQSEFTIWSGKNKESTLIRYKSGLFQGDSLSPLLFCLCTAPMSWALSKNRGVFSNVLGKTITHTLFIDDLKIYTRSRGTLIRVLSRVKKASKAIGMRLNIAKCATATMVMGVPRYGSAVTINGEAVPTADIETPYKYLGVLQAFAVRHKENKASCVGKYLKRVRSIWRTRLPGPKQAELMGSWAMGVLKYHFIFTEWSVVELRAVDRLTRKILIEHQAHHPKASVARLYLPRRQGGRGLQSLEQIYERETVSAAFYLVNASDSELQAIRASLFEDEVPTHTIAKAQTILDKYDTDIKLTRNGVVNPDNTQMCCKAVNKLVKAGQWRALELELAGKTIHGVHRRQVGEKGFNKKLSWSWIRTFPGKSETEALIFAAQDGVLLTRRYCSRILGQNVKLECRKCRGGEESIGHILAKCPIYQWTLFKERHDKIVYLIARNICSFAKAELPPSLQWGKAEYTGNGSFGDRQNVYVEVDMLQLTIDPIKHRRPDIVVHNRSTNTVTIMDVAVAWEPLLLERETEKRGKYEPLARDMGRRKRKSEQVLVRPLVVGDLGTVARLKQELTELEMWDGKAVKALVTACQLEAVFYAARIIRGHLPLH